MLTKIRHLCITWAAVLCLGLLLWSSGSLATWAQTARPSEFSISSNERARIIDEILSNPQVIEGTRNQRLRVLSVTLASPEKQGDSRVFATQELSQAIIFNYSTGKASRLLVDRNTNEVIGEEVLPGRPQSSVEELQQATRIIQGNPQLAQMLQGGSVLEGGFVVDAPPGAPVNNRYVQIHVLSGNRRQIQRVVIVDLTSNTIASAATNFR
jgi:hypothetical protein